MQAKLPCQPFRTIYRVFDLLELIYSDVCDSGRVYRGGNKYFITSIDDFSKYYYVYLMKTKDEVLNKFKIYKVEAENQTQSKIKILRSNRGGSTPRIMSLCSAKSMALYMRSLLHIHLNQLE